MHNFIDNLLLEHFTDNLIMTSSTTETAPTIEQEKRLGLSSFSIPHSYNKLSFISLRILVLFLLLSLITFYYRYIVGFSALGAFGAMIYTINRKTKGWLVLIIHIQQYRIFDSIALKSHRRIDTEHPKDPCQSKGCCCRP